MKNTPHDFYPTFPDNPLMGHVGAHPQVTEYDVNGQFFGWGAQPSAMLKDIRHRLRYAKEHNVKGFMARTDWEGVQDWTCFDNLNLLNLYGIAAIADDEDISDTEICMKWLQGEKMLREDLNPGEIKQYTEKISEIMEQTWPIVEKTNFVNGCLFSNDSCLHLTPDQFTFIGGTHHSLSEWDPEKKDALAMTPENIQVIINDKEEAWNACRKLVSYVENNDLGLNEAADAKFREHFDFMKWYVRGFRLTARGYCFGRFVEEENRTQVIAENKTAEQLLMETIQDMTEYLEELKAQNFLKKYPFDAQLNPERVALYRDTLQKMYAGGRVLYEQN